MPDNPVQEVITDLLGYIENLETQTGAILQFLKDNGIATDEKLAPYLEQASKSADVKARAARARIGHLLKAGDEVKSSTEVVPAAANQKETPSTPQPPTDHSQEQSKHTADKKQPSEIVAASIASKETPRAAPQDSNDEPISSNETKHEKKKDAA